MWNPPGVGSGTASIAGDKTGADIHINANAGAALGDWPLVVVATADVGGAVQVSSQPATLTIVDAYVDFALEQSRVTQGAESEMVIKLTRNDLAKIAPPTPASQPASAPAAPKFTARVELRGLPGGVSVPVGEIDTQTPELRFALKAAPDARVGRHGGVFVHTVVSVNGEPVRFKSANGLLIVDKPLPPKKNAPPKPKQAKPKPTKKKEKKKRVRLPRRTDVKPIGGEKP